MDNDRSVCGEQYRYIRDSDGSEELYDTVADPNEWHNLADDSALRRVKRELSGWIPEENVPRL